jgi:hypothetical protein
MSGSTDFNETHLNCMEHTKVHKIIYSVWLIHYTEKYFPFWILKIGILSPFFY